MPTFVATPYDGPFYIRLSNDYISYSVDHHSFVIDYDHLGNVVGVEFLVDAVVEGLVGTREPKITQID